MNDRQHSSRSAAFRLITQSRLLGPIALMALVAAGVTASAAWSHVRLGESIGLVQTIHPNADVSESPLATGRVRRIDLSAFEDGTIPRRLVAARWSEQQPRVVFLSTRRGMTSAEDVIRADRFEEVRRNTNTASPFS
jgi:hypothetical protein